MLRSIADGKILLLFFPLPYFFLFLPLPHRTRLNLSSSTGSSGSTGGGQFICTTFRPEMLLVAEKCYGVRYLGNKSSSVVVVGRDEALKFVEGEKQ